MAQLLYQQTAHLCTCRILFTTCCSQQTQARPWSWCSSYKTLEFLTYCSVQDSIPGMHPSHALNIQLDSRVYLHRRTTSFFNPWHPACVFCRHFSFWDSNQYWMIFKLIWLLSRLQGATHEPCWSPSIGTTNNQWFAVAGWVASFWLW